jgi:uncharacterized protein
MAAGIDLSGNRSEILIGLGRMLLQRSLTREEGIAAKEALEGSSGREVVDAVHVLVEDGTELDRLKPVVSKLINLVSKPLDSIAIELQDPFLRSFVLENAELLLRLDRLRPLISTLSADSEGASAELLERFRLGVVDMRAIGLHYSKMENILFPRIEASYPKHSCLALMWAIHDDVRETLENLAELLAPPAPASGEHARALVRSLAGKLFYDANALVFREEKLLFPLVAELLSINERLGLYAEAKALGFCFLDEVTRSGLDAEAAAAAPLGIDTARYIPAVQGKLSLDCGSLQSEVLDSVLKLLPVDLTFVDADDKVAYFSNGESRIFARSRAIIGRDVRNCHPAKSVDKVLAIIESFKKGERENEFFWLETEGRFVRIEYRAVRDTSGAYLGTLEISQDLTEARALEGEKRLAAP